MTRKVLECRRLIPNSKCTLLLIGELDEIVPTFQQHVASAHPQADAKQLSAETAPSVQALVVQGQDRAYVGDQLEKLDTGGVRVNGPGFVL